MTPQNFLRLHALFLYLNFTIEASCGCICACFWFSRARYFFDVGLLSYFDVHSDVIAVADIVIKISEKKKRTSLDFPSDVHLVVYIPPHTFLTLTFGDQRKHTEIASTFLWRTNDSDFGIETFLVVSMSSRVLSNYIIYFQQDLNPF